VLHATEVLRRKAGDAWTTMGETFAPLLLERSQSADTQVGPDDAQAPEALRRIWHRWLDGPMATRGPEAPDAAALPARIAGVRAPFDAWIAVVERGDAAELIAARAGGAATNDPRSVLEVARAADGPSRVTSPSRANRVLREIDAYVESTRAAADAGISGVGSRTHANAAGHIASLAASAPPHRRIVVSRLAAGARRAIDHARSAGAERLLGALVSARNSAHDAADSAEAWLERVIELGPAPPPNAGAATGAGEAGEAVVRAVLLLVC
jgi:hypothetical protein